MSHELRIGTWCGLPDKGLAPRELTCVLRIACGMSDKQIAARDGLAVTTVRNAVERAMHKLGADKRAQLVAEAMRRGLIAPAMAMFLAVITCSSVASTDPIQRVRRGGSHSAAAGRVLRRSEWVV